MPENAWICPVCQEAVGEACPVAANGHCEGCCDCYVCSRCDAHVARVTAEDPRCERCRGCDSCCECAFCAGCETRCERVCTYCERCEGCCTCEVCSRCETHLTEDDSFCASCGCCAACCGRREGRLSEDNIFCSSCDYCTACCRCERYAETNSSEVLAHVLYVDRPTKFWRAAANEHPTGYSQRLIAAEIEVAGCYRHGQQVNQIAKKWSCSVVHDGSLPYGGFEICTAPASGQFFVQQINEICAALREQQAFVTQACGLHVHVDSRDLELRHLANLVRLYANLEDLFFRAVPPSRRHNDFCRRCGSKLLERFAGVALYTKEAFNLADALDTAIYGSKERAEKAKQNRRPDVRYDALNLHSHFYRGTVELRLAAGTTNPDKIINWAQIFALLVDAAYTWSDATITEYSQNSGVHALLNDIVQSWKLRRWFYERIDKFAHQEYTQLVKAQVYDEPGEPRTTPDGPRPS